MIKVKISYLNYSLIKYQLKKILSDLSASSTNIVPLPGETVLKTEETHQSECESETDTIDILLATARITDLTVSLKQKEKPTIIVL